MAEDLRHIINDLGMELFTIHEHDNANIQWNRDTWFDHLKKADIIIAPANWKKQPAKSANRVTQALFLGKSVVCSPLPAYLEVAKKHPGSFLIADTPEEWKERLTLLKNTPSFREQLGKRAKVAAEDFSIDVIGQKWAALFREIGSAESVVDIVIPTYKNIRGMKLCLDSIRACTEIPYRLIIVNNGNEEMQQFLEKQKNIDLVWKPKLTFAQAVNIGLKKVTSKYAMILNDDVIVSRGWLRNMVEACTEGIGAVGLFSNCDKGWLHSRDVNIGGVDLLPGINTYEDIEPIIPQIYEYKSDITEIKEQEWVAFYATLIPLEVIKKVGYLDESFTNSGEDIDYCKRIRKMGFNIVQTYKSFIFHFGAVSRKILEKEDHGSYHKADESTQVYLKTKYSRKTIVLYSGPSWERWSFENVEKGGIGGSEIWQISLAREFDKLGYRVISFCDIPIKEMWDGDIRYIHYSHFHEFVDENYIDYFISSRTIDPLKYNVRAGKIYVMVHDIWLFSQKDQLFQEKVDKYCVLSKWHWDFFKNHHGITDDSKMLLTSNGIYFDRYDNKDIKRHQYRMFWSSSLDRGLDTLLYLFDFIKKEIPELELHVYYGMETWKRSVKQKNDENGLKKIKEIEEGMKKPGVFYHGRVDQKTLAEAQLACSLWAYPTDFEEVFCCLPDTKIKTFSQGKNIQDIQKGDSVYTHSGMFKKVIKTMSRQVKEDIYSIDVKYLMDSLKITGEHPVFAIKRESVRCKRLSHTVCRKRGKRCFKGHCYSSKNGKRYYSKVDCSELFMSYLPEWTTVEELKKGDFLVYPRNKNNIKSRNFSFYSSDDLIEGSMTHIHTKATKFKDFLINGGFLGLCGWYTSEGSFDGKSIINFALNMNEKEEIKFICDQLDEIGLKYRIDTKDELSSSCVVTHSAILGRFFAENFGSGAKEKKIPQWVRSLPKTYLSHFLKGLIKGDGGLDRDALVYECSSEGLVLDLFDALLKFDCVSSLFRTYKNNIKSAVKRGERKLIKTGETLPAFRLICSMNQNRNLFEFLGLFHECNKREGHNYYIMDEDYVYFPIFKKVKEKYEGFVYNFEVEEDNSYVANNVIVHNCITAIEAQRSGCAVVTSNYAGLQSILNDSAVMVGDYTKGQSYGKTYREEFVKACIDLLKYEDKRQEWIEKGLENSKRFSWESVAKRWHELFKGV